MLLGMRWQPLGAALPTLNLNFTTMTALPSTITFSRPSNATYYDSTGKLTYAPNNLLTYSNTFSNAAWQNAGTTPVFTSGFTDPDGNNTAWRVQLPSSSYVSQPKSITAGVNYIISFWVKSNTGSNQSFRLWGQDNTFISGDSVATTSWQRFSFTFTSTSTGVSSQGLRNPVSNAAVDLLIYGAQFELVTYQTTPGTYNATTSAAYYGARLDYKPATLAARGLLIEEARTNVHPQSSLQSGYSNYGGTLTANAATSIDGTSNAASLVIDLTTGQHGAFYAAGVNTNAATYTASVYAKKLGPTNYFINFDPENSNSIAQTAVFNISAGTVLQVGSNIQSASIVDCGNGFYRLIVTYTAAAGNRNPILYGCTSTSSRVFTGDGVSGWVLFGFQVELGSFATSYIPTAGGPVSRSADTASMTGTNFSSWYNASEGSFIALAASVRPTSGGGGVLAHTLDTSNNINMDSNGNRVCYVNSGGVNVVDLSPGGVTTNVFAKFGQAYKVNDYAAVINAGTVLTDTSGALPNTPIQLLIGNNSSNQILNGWASSIVFYRQRLPNATLQSLTATAPTDNGLVWGDGNYLIWDTDNFLTWG